MRRVTEGAHRGGFHAAPHGVLFRSDGLIALSTRLSPRLDRPIRSRGKLWGFNGGTPWMNCIGWPADR